MPQQLQMLWPESRLLDPPAARVPAGYTLRTFQVGDAAAFLGLMHKAGFTSWDAATLERWVLRAMPDGFFVIVHDATGALVATASASHNADRIHPAGGELGWVAGDSAHARRGLGRTVCAAVVRRFLAAGYRRIYLRTDDWRLPAIQVYLQLGFVPLLHDADMPDRWKGVCEKLGRPFTPDSWPRAEPPSAIGLPGAPGERPDADCLANYPERRRWHPERAHRSYPGGGDMDAFGDESLYPASRLGRATIEPCQVAAGATAPLCVRYTVGPAGLPAGSIVTLAIRGQGPLGKRMKFATVEGPAGCRLELRWNSVTVAEGLVAEGGTVTLSAAPFEWTPLAGRREFKLIVQSGPNAIQQRLPEPLVVNMLPGAPHHLDVFLPATHRPGERLEAAVRVRDAADNPVSVEGALRLDGPADTTAEKTDMESTAGSANPLAAGSQSLLYCDAALREGRAGITVSAPTSGPGPLRLSVRAPGVGLAGASNPSVPSDDFQLYVGDLHSHDFLSAAEGYPDDVYRWARDEKRLDFVSVVPQSHGWHDNETWTVTKFMSERFLDERRFVTFLGLEWQHTGYGDKVIHFLGGDQPYLPVDDPRYRTPAKLYAALRTSDAFVISHHPAYPFQAWCPMTDFDAVETDIERVVELWSMHGSSEGYDPADRPLVEVGDRNVYTALRQGVRLGFVAGSDTHSARPGGSAKEPRPYWGGLAAVWARGLTRRDLFEAIRARRTYALTRARIVARFTVNGAWMGSELPAADRAAIRLTAWGTGPIAKVEIMKNASVLRTFGPFGDHVELDCDDAANGAAFYHCRITQADGELAVCSPVWIGPPNRK